MAGYLNDYIFQVCVCMCMHVRTYMGIGMDACFYACGSQSSTIGTTLHALYASFLETWPLSILELPN